MEPLRCNEDEITLLTCNEDLLEITLQHLDWPSLVRLRTASCALSQHSTFSLANYGVLRPTPKVHTANQNIPPGVLHLIGTGFGTASFSASRLCQRVLVANSSSQATAAARNTRSPLLVLPRDPDEVLGRRDVFNNPLEMFLDQEQGHRIFMNEGKGWYQVDLGPQLLVVPSGFALRHNSGQDRAVRNFDISASVDGIEWDLLSRHLDDDKLGVEFGSVGVWALNDIAGKAYRYFRATKTGPDAAESARYCSYTHMSGIEIYGALRVCLDELASDGAPAEELQMHVEEERPDASAVGQI